MKMRSENKFEQIIVIGNGKIAVDCCKSFFDRSLVVQVIESQFSAVSMLKTICAKQGNPYICLDTVDETMRYINDAVDHKKSLIISANNEYIFSADICKMKNVQIINFHYSYLPDYRGMNIPTWVIYNDEDYTGVSWHYVNEKIDDGAIIARQKFAIEKWDRAIDIVKKGMIIGRDLFEQIIDDILLEKVLVTEPNYCSEIKCYSRNQLPNDGYLSELLSEKEIAGLLRAYDYGPVRYFSPLKFKGDNYEKKIIRYRILNDGILMLGGEGWKPSYSIKKDNYSFDLLLEDDD